MKLATALLPSLVLAIALGHADPTSAAALASSAAPAHTALTQQTTPRLVVKYRAALAKAAAASGPGLAVARDAASARLARYPLSRVKIMASGAVVYHLGAELTLEQARVVAARIAKDPAVESAEPDLRVRPHALTRDTYSDRQWPLLPRAKSLGGADFGGAWAATKGAGILVGVIDTGDVPHADLSGRVVPGYDFVSADADGTFATAGDGDGRDSDPSDPGDFCDSEGTSSSWHGLGVAGLIASNAGNNLGIAGAAPLAQVMHLRALGRCGGFLSDAADALSWSAGVHLDGIPDNTTPVHVANLSLGSEGVACPRYVQAAVDAAISRNVVVVASAGNAGVGQLASPANCQGVIAVGAHTQSGDLADYSNRGTALTLTAPGGGICMSQAIAKCLSDPPVTVSNNGVRGPVADLEGFYFAGTSASAPHVAAAVALMRSVNPDLTPAQITAILVATAKPHASDSYCAAHSDECGAGMLDAAAAVQAASSGVLSVTSSLTGRFAAAGDDVTLTASVSGGLGSSFVWTQESGKPVTMRGANTAAMSFTAPKAGGVLKFKVTATTIVGSTLTQTYTVEVNSPPKLTSTSFSVAPGKQLSATLTAQDDDGDAVVFSLVDGPNGMTISGNTLTWLASVAGSYDVRVMLTDARGVTSEATLTVTVSETPKSDGGTGGGAADVLFALMLAGALLLVRRQRTR